MRLNDGRHQIEQLISWFSSVVAIAGISNSASNRRPSRRSSS